MCFKTLFLSIISACVCVAALDSYKHTARSIPEWSEPDMESVSEMFSQKKNTHSLPTETHITIEPHNPVSDCLTLHFEFQQRNYENLQWSSSPSAVLFCVTVHTGTC